MHPNNAMQYNARAHPHPEFVMSGASRESEGRTRECRKETGEPKRKPTIKDEAMKQNSTFAFYGVYSPSRELWVGPARALA